MKLREIREVFRYQFTTKTYIHVNFKYKTKQYDIGLEKPKGYFKYEYDKKQQRR